MQVQFLPGTGPTTLVFNLLWCNGNTVVFGTVIPGSNPGRRAVFRVGNDTENLVLTP